MRVTAARSSTGLALLAFLAVLPPAVLLAPPAGADGATQGAPQQATQESDSPIADQGGSYDYRSYITSIVPQTPGLHLQVLEFADRLQLTNRSGKAVTVYGYSGEPYARVLADGTVELNERSPAYYLNQSFYAAVSVPASASAVAPPQWTVVDRTGRLEWHDHRIHWMSPVTPPQVKDKGKRTKIFDWSVPIAVGTRHGAVDGQLFWVPQASSGAPTAAIAALVAIVLLGLLFVVLVRRRRQGGGTPREPAAGAGDASKGGEQAAGGEGSDGEPSQRPSREAW